MALSLKNGRKGSLIFNFIRTELDGVWIVEAIPRFDSRGGFVRVFCKKEFALAGLIANFVQINHSFNTHAGTLRGFHYQVPPAAESKLIHCVAGKAYDMVVDLRAGSSTFLKWIGVELDDRNGRLIYIPEGCAHGFITLADNTQLIYHHTAYYAPEAEVGLAYNDPMVGVRLPREIAVISEKDRGYPLLNNSFTGITTEAAKK
jgi:dTDP-4-dehydrorhamnose 3,5-epimerase